MRSSGKIKINNRYIKTVQSGAQNNVLCLCAAYDGKVYFCLYSGVLQDVIGSGI